MPVEFTLTCPLPNGVHARPASAIEAHARLYDSAITILNERVGRAASAKSVLGIVSLDIRQDDRCQVLVAGPDEREAAEGFRRFMEREFPLRDEPLPRPAGAARMVRLPALLAGAGVDIRSGTSVVPGIAQGKLVLIGGFAIPPSIPRDCVGDVSAELRTLDSALERLTRGYDQEIERRTDGVGAAVLTAHRAIARDPEFRARLGFEVGDHRRTVAGAVEVARTSLVAMLTATGSELLRERAMDVGDVCAELLRQAYGSDAGWDETRLIADSICAAESLSPQQFLSLDRRHLKGLVLAHGGTTSHTVILARSCGIPTLVGVGDLESAGLDGQAAIVDGDLGVLVTNVDDQARRYYEMEKRRHEGRRAYLSQFGARDGQTADGHRFEIAANVASAEETAGAFADGAQGVGLFRTEMLFVNRPQAASEDEQFEEYRRALIVAGGRPVIIRMLDVGGDKPIPYLRLPEENNPFLGCRGVRMYPELDAIVRVQVRALLRASAFGRLKIMIPMVSCLEEVDWVRALVGEAQAALAGAGVPHDPLVPIGAMVEVPSAVFILDHLCRHVDFFSVGSNDLLQYFVAADRGNQKVTGLYNALQPAFLRLLRKVVDDIHAGNRWVGVCGEIGGQLDYLPLLVGLGFDEISMASPFIRDAKAKMSHLSGAACRALVGEAADCSTAGEVAGLLESAAVGQPQPLLEPGLIMVDADCRTKEEVIKALVDRLYVASRTDRPRDVEEATWQREAVYSTGFGHGFAIPHCKTDAVSASSLAILRLDRPVDWGALDGEPVRVVILLAIRESDPATAHMKVLASLARQLMHEEFRDRLALEQDPGVLCRYLTERIGA